MSSASISQSVSQQSHSMPDPTTSNNYNARNAQAITNNNSRSLYH